MDIVGIGTDIIECLRIKRMIDRHGELFLNRVYTEREIRYCQSRKRATEHFAGRWAAKEAILKCLGTGWQKGISWTDMEIRNDPNGKPLVHMCGAAKDRAQVSSVSTDEEMADMVRFQRAYEASARLMTTVDQMLDRLINSTGMVGR